MTRKGHRPIRRALGLLVSASLHGILLIGLTGWPARLSLSLHVPLPHNEPVQVEIVDLTDLRDHAFDFDIEKIGSRVGRLFPFTEPISLSSIPRTSGTAGDIGIFVMNSGLAAPSPALRLSPSEMQSLLDASWSRRQRWDSFQQMLDLVRRFDPQQGDLPMLLRRYVSDNLLQPFHASRNPEPKLWGLLSVAADHFDFVQFITSFVEKVPSSKVTTELLFLLDKLVQASLQAALSLFAVDTVNGIEWTKSVSPKGAETLVTLKRHHEDALNNRGLWDETAIAYGYDEVRIGILEHLIRTTPQRYRINDARFLIGEIYWHQGRLTDARDAWRRIRPVSSDEYFTVYSDIRTNLTAEPINRAPIDRALSEQMRRWIHASFQRLRHFGFQFDTF